MNWEPSERFDEWQGCLGCVHWRGGTCVAYPRGVPLMIVGGEVDHMVPRPGQVGDTVFEPIDWEVYHTTRQRVPSASPAEPQRAGQTPGSL
jgi:hypothetical protein